MSIEEQLAEIQERGIIAMQQVAVAKFDAARKTKLKFLGDWQC